MKAKISTHRCPSCNYPLYEREDMVICSMGCLDEWMPIWNLKPSLRGLERETPAIKCRKVVDSFWAGASSCVACGDDLHEKWNMCKTCDGEDIAELNHLDNAEQAATGN